MTSNTNFVDDFCTYISSVSPRFYYGDGDVPAGKVWLRAGELQRDTPGVYCVANATREPDPEDGIMYFSVTFWSLNPSTQDGYNNLQVLFDLFFGNHSFSTNNYYIFQSFLDGQVVDEDRTQENNKVLSLSATLFVRYLIS